MKTMKIDGHCHCGAISFEAEVDPAAMGICHCTDCQMLTGSAFRLGISATAQSFKLTSGEPTIYVKTADSGAKRRHAFCGRCGTPIYACDLIAPTHYTLRPGAISQRQSFSPMRQIWRRSAFHWIDAIGEVPIFDLRRN